MPWRAVTVNLKCTEKTLCTFSVVVLLLNRWRIPIFMAVSYYRLLLKLKVGAHKWEEFFPDNDCVRQVDHIKGYWNPKRKLRVTTHFFRDNCALVWRKTLNRRFFRKMIKSYFFLKISECKRELAQMKW